METISDLSMLLGTFSLADQLMRWITETLSFSDGTKARDSWTAIWRQRTAWVMKRPRSKQWTGADHVYSVKGCEITELGPGPPGSCLCICQFACFPCVCMQTQMLTLRDRVRLRSFEIPAFLWGILSVIYLSWALWACTSTTGVS